MKLILLYRESKRVSIQIGKNFSKKATEGTTLERSFPLFENLLFFIKSKRTLSFCRHGNKALSKSPPVLRRVRPEIDDAPPGQDLHGIRFGARPPKTASSQAFRLRGSGARPCRVESRPCRDCPEYATSAADA